MSSIKGFCSISNRRLPASNGVAAPFHYLAKIVGARYEFEHAAMRNLVPQLVRPPQVAQHGISMDVGSPTGAPDEQAHQVQRLPWRFSLELMRQEPALANATKAVGVGYLYHK